VDRLCRGCREDTWGDDCRLGDAVLRRICAFDPLMGTSGKSSLLRSLRFRAPNEGFRSQRGVSTVMDSMIDWLRNATRAAQRLGLHLKAQQHEKSLRKRAQKLPSGDHYGYYADDGSGGGG
jgi:hypothetical protein